MKNMQKEDQLQDLHQIDYKKHLDDKSQVWSSVVALLYKSIKIQQKNYCSNICQIITPLLCIAFTLLAQILAGEILSGKIQTFNFPQPLDNPYFYTVAGSLNLSCQQDYLYQSSDLSSSENVKFILNHTLKYYCQKSQSFMPAYHQSNDINSYIMNQLKKADTQAFQRGNDLKTLIPDGFIKFKQVTPNKLDVIYGINDQRLPQYHKNNGVTKIILKTSENQQITSYLRVTQGMMSLMQKINRAFLQLSHPKQIIMSSIMYMPFDGQDKSLKNKVINILGAGLYPLGLSLLLPLFLYAIVNEKQEKLIEIMKMNGLNVKYYWISTFLFNFAITSLMLFIFYSFGRWFLKLTMFVETHPTVFWALLIGWAIALISMNNFVQIFINSAKSATIVGYLLSIFSCFIGQAICTFIYAYPQKVPIPILMYPPFALCRAIYLIGYNCASNSSCYKGLNQTQQEFIIILVILFGWFFIYIFSIYLNDMVQQQYGVAKYPNFVKKCLIFFNKKAEPIQLIEQNFSEHTNIDEVAQIQMSESTKFVISDPLTTEIDETVFAQNQRVSKLQISSKPMIIKGLSKKYEIQSGQNKQYIALKPLTLSLQDKQIFGLLGPNGAGKTTMISVITGMYPQTSGNAWINGVSIGESSTNKLIGVCPQFDLLWTDLSVYEHLKFYSLLKMVESDMIEQEINSLLKDVDLDQWRDTPSSQLSGGMQRRLSLAISLVGNPKVVFLDEPSSGLDPSHRRQMWNILLKCKKRTSILLTTHLMEEAEVLCDRVGIINKGQLRCVGKIQELKQKYGKGYRLTISYSTLLKNHIKRKSQTQSSSSIPEISQNDLIKKNESSISSAQSSISSTKSQYFRPILVDNLIDNFKAEIINELNTRVILKIDKSTILDCINELKNEKQINWLVSQPSLYDVFVHFVK